MNQKWLPLSKFQQSRLENKNEVRIVLETLTKKIVGTIDYNLRSGEIRHIYMYDGYHGFKIGTQLLQQTMMEMKKASVNKVFAVAYRDHPYWTRLKGFTCYNVTTTEGINRYQYERTLHDYFPLPCGCPHLYIPKKKIIKCANISI